MTSETPSASPDSSEPDSSGNGSQKDSGLAELRNSRRVSWLLDECIRIPGTNIRFGLDPILGLIPYGGETVATVVGATILGQAGKKGLPLKTLFKMGGNMLLNAGLGVIPGLGDLFSVWFKSNSRNYQMMNTYLESEHGDEEPGGWWPLFLIFGTIGVVFLINVISWILFTTVIVWVVKQAGSAA